LKRIILLGATGSVGTGACDVVRAHPDEFKVVALAARSNRAAAESLACALGARAYVGEDAAVRAVEENEADIALVATVGLSGLAPTLAAIEKGMPVALATKEVLVAAGALVTARAREKGVRILPVDSEHSAIFQCLQSPGRSPADRLVLTASGGPFRDGPADLSAVTPEMALAHPVWRMGPKVTVDSATMMNKGFEVIEAHWLFGVPFGRIGVVVHPESVVHSLVTFADGATLAQLSPPDMRVPIQYALSWPDRLSADRAALDLVGLGALTFRAPEEDRFPCLRLARTAAEAGGTRAAALSAADEVAVARFLAGSISYTDIPRLVADALDAAPDLPCDSVENILAADAAGRKLAEKWNS
jgi:1-deoxy-D-xylulose-5-phosphate reductoisomerase